ncbi:MAG: zinc-binding alcohol dehydrogenase [Phycisphaerae bacterium]
MKAQALICDAQQKFTLEDVILEDPKPDQVAIRTQYGGVSIGTEFALIRHKISWGPYPLCTGYMGTGVITAAGAQTQGFKVGDQVYFRQNESMRLANGSAVSCVSGAHCSHAVLKPHTTHGVAHVTPGASMEVASMFVMPAVGLYGVDMANPRTGQTVVVHGVGLIGLGVVAACAQRGCVVIAVDLSERNLETARQLGADHLLNGQTQKVAEAVQALAPEGADVVFECTGIPACIDQAIPLCRTHGSFVWQGNYGDNPISLNFSPAHIRRLRIFFPCDDGWQPFRRAVVKNMAVGVLPWEKTITHRVADTEAPALYSRINQGAADVLGAVIKWS